MKPFDLEAARAGAPVQTRDGRAVRIVCFDVKDEYPILALVKIFDGREVTLKVSEKGIEKDCAHNNLVMAPIKKKHG